MAERVEAVQQASQVFRVLAHPARLRLALALCNGEEVCVRDLASIIGRPPPYVSQHLAVLRRVGIVGCRRQGPHVLYRLIDPQLCAMLATAQLVVQTRPRPADEWSRP
jgi:DNA-binding transcriptional ArsR family regulator